MIALTEDEKKLLLAFPGEAGAEIDELSLARSLGWTHLRVRQTMRSLELKGLARTSGPAS